MDLRAGVLWLFGKHLRRTKEAVIQMPLLQNILEVLHTSKGRIILCCWVRYDWSKGEAGHCFCGILKETVCSDRRWNRIVFSLCE